MQLANLFSVVKSSQACCFRTFCIFVNANFYLFHFCKFQIIVFLVAQFRYSIRIIGHGHWGINVPL